jgi:tRNA (uracil-5-)-methyltransferase TRM9
VRAQPEMATSYSVVDVQSSDCSELVLLSTRVATREQYSKYYRSGVYDARYPCANQSTLQVIRSKITPASRILDFGCGSGRYTESLASNCRGIVAYDPSPEAIDLLKLRVQRQTNISHAPKLEDIQRAGPYDVAICIFGVLSHIPDKQVRRNTLKFLRESLDVGGWLVVSVPNRFRRFYKEQLVSAFQRGDCSGQIDYRRGCVDQLIPYYLYTEKTLRKELRECGFLVEAVKPESVMPETFVTKFAYAPALEKKLLPKIPPWLGYGILATAQRR